jgi:plastocyanin
MRSDRKRRGTMAAARKKAIVGSVLAILTAAVVAAPPAGAGVATTYQVQVGAPLFAEPLARGAPADGMRFYTPDLTVHQGDTVLFNLAGFHTATLLPANTDTDAWVAANAGDFGKPFSLIGPDPDEALGSAKFNNAALLPVPLDCGRPADPCIYDGSTVVNSGVINPDNLNAQGVSFSATIDASPGDVVTFLCLVHINMRSTLTVVADTEEASTQAEIDEYRDRRVTRDARAASRLHRALLADGQDGGRIVDAFAGVDGPGFSLLEFYPRTLDLDEGQRVRWHFEELVFEDHTVTFPLKKGLRIANRSFLPVCDTDGDTGSAPDTEPDFSATTLDGLCPGGVAELEFDVDRRFGLPAGDGMVTGRRDFENSGIAGANVTDAGTYVLRFDAASGNRPFKFLCLIHPFMQGEVFVA